MSQDTPPSDIRTKRGLIVPEVALQWTFARASGPGGQHVNKTSSRATLTIDVGLIAGPERTKERMLTALASHITVTCQESRSQWRNRQSCIEQVVDIIDTAAAPPPKVRKKSKPSRGAIERRLSSKKKDSETKSLRQRPTGD